MPRRPRWYKKKTPKVVSIDEPMSVPEELAEAPPSAALPPPAPRAVGKSYTEMVPLLWETSYAATLADERRALAEMGVMMASLNLKASAPPGLLVFRLVHGYMSMIFF